MGRFYKNPVGVIESAMHDLHTVMVRISNVNNNEYGLRGPQSAVLTEMYKNLYAGRELYAAFLKVNGLL